MVAVLIAILLFLSPVMPGTAVSDAPFHAKISGVEIAHEDCEDSRPHTAPGQCCALQCLMFVAQAAPSEVRHVPSFVDVAYGEPVDHMIGIIFPPSLGPPRPAA